jgi:hypothetical protein
MKTIILSASALVLTAVFAGSALADASVPATTMAPIANPAESAKPMHGMHHGHHHHGHHGHHHHHK